MFGSRKEKLVLAALAAGMLGAGSIWAQTGPRGQDPDGLGPMRGFERLHRDLKLSAPQEDLWKKAQETQREASRTLRAKGEENRAKLRVEIDKPGADLKKFAQLRDELRSQMQAQMDKTRAQVRTAWFAVYDALDANQKERVRLAIRDGMDRGHRHGPRGRPRADFGTRQGTS